MLFGPRRQGQLTKTGPIRPQVIFNDSTGGHVDAPHFRRLRLSRFQHQQRLFENLPLLIDRQNTFPRQH
jgi:hypothetical protein